MAETQTTEEGHECHPAQPDVGALPKPSGHQLHRGGAQVNTKQGLWRQDSGDKRQVEGDTRELANTFGKELQDYLSTYFVSPRSASSFKTEEFRTLSIKQQEEYQVLGPFQGSQHHQTFTKLLLLIVGLLAAKAEGT